ncbi:MAG: galactokinase [Ruminococcaceae bacterium]|nr:galactokinase [Oscillospiraceae bacterium]
MELREITAMFLEQFGGDETDLRVFVSPGRVNLIGEHTDYNGGFVFPAALDMKTTIVCRKRADRKIVLRATDLDVVVEADIDRLNDYRNLDWGNYQLGVAYVLQQAGYDICGLDMLYDDTVPHGGGLSSSAAIEVATALCFATLSNEKNGITAPVDMIAMAKFGQQAENEYVGVNCGIMDQFASAMGKENCAIFLDCKDLSYRYAPLDLNGKRIVIANTNKKRSLGDSKYNERRSECEVGFALLQKELPDKNCLGEISRAEFEAHKHLITDPVVCKRVEHVINEDDRVLRSIEALEAGDMAEFGALMNQSHDSLRDLYEVTGIELDTLVDEARKIEGTLGSRMTGAGFGGCTVSIVEDTAVERFIDEVGKNYQAKTGLTASFYVSNIGDGGRELK